MSGFISAGAYKRRMEIIQLKYIAEVSKTGSITQAANNLGMNQPNLSKAIRALEKDLGFLIFKRSSKGVFFTKEGLDFWASAKEALEKFEELEANHKTSGAGKHSLRISVPRASYIAYAFVKFVEEISNVKSLQFDFCETNSIQAIRNVSSKKHNIGIIRFSTEHERYYYKLLNDLDLCAEVFLEFEYVVLMSDSSPLAQNHSIEKADLDNMIEIVNGDSYIPASLTEEIVRPSFGGVNPKTIHIYERGSQFDLLTMIPSTFMWVSPIPKKLLERYALIQKETSTGTFMHKDVLIYRKDYNLTKTECLFLKHLYRLRDNIKK